MRSKGAKGRCWKPSWREKRGSLRGSGKGEGNQSFGKKKKGERKLRHVYINTAGIDNGHDYVAIRKPPK